MTHGEGGDGGCRRKVRGFGPYRLTGRVLGEGSFGRVEEAVHGLLGVKVAVKVIDTARLSDDYCLRNLHREASLLSRLSHPNIVSLFQAVRGGPVYLLAMERVLGGDLRSHVRSREGGRLCEEAARRFGRQLVSAVAHMHSRGVVHRDLKMENVLLDEQKKHIKIVDFGLSNLWDARTRLSTNCGSPEYAAPELFDAGKRYGPGVDLWSLGVILFGMVAGRLPFVLAAPEAQHSGRTRKHVELISKGLGEPQRSAIADKSPEFQNVVSRLLTPNARARISIRELSLHPWITGHQKINPTPGNKHLHTEAYSLAVSKLSKLLRMDVEAVRKRVSEDSNGDIAGALNIAVHLQLRGGGSSPAPVRHAQVGVPPVVGRPPAASRARGRDEQSPGLLLRQMAALRCGPLQRRPAVARQTSHRHVSTAVSSPCVNKCSRSSQLPCDQCKYTHFKMVRGMPVEIKTGEAVLGFNHLFECKKEREYMKSSQISERFNILFMRKTPSITFPHTPLT
ncbi:uncharacterized protein LOC134532876 isoform X2 [Bacillus rossius redtenbacheri]|uniref:uncharacterized protein LOC134532876 isoform X2 n=1 Tax=Bacillus rossius redtenbacheri TaxID=93214 RepID=UPI002FDE6AFA